MAMPLADLGNGELSNGSVVQVVQVNTSDVADEISPLLVEEGDSQQRMNIFSVSYDRKRPPKEKTLSGVEADVNFLSQIFIWVWRGSKYSGLLCMASSSVIYYIMEALIDIFPVQRVPVFESVFTRCTIISISSILWLKKVGHPVVAPKLARNLLILRSLCGFISLLSFIYSVKNIPLAHAICLNFATPIVASICARIILKEKFTLSDIGGLSLSYLGILFVFQPGLLAQESGQINDTVSTTGRLTLYAVSFGLLSSLFSGVCYCLIKAAAKISDNPVYTVLSFGLLASPISAIYTLALQEFVLPNIFTLFLMAVLSVLAFFAEVALARGLQLEKICKATNMIYVQVIFSLAWNILYLGTPASFNKLIGCLLILVSVCSTLYFGPEMEPNDA